MVWRGEVGEVTEKAEHGTTETRHREGVLAEGGRSLRELAVLSRQMEALEKASGRPGWQVGGAGAPEHVGDEARAIRVQIRMWGNWLRSFDRNNWLHSGRSGPRISPRVEDPSELSVAELGAILKEKGLPVSGKKAELITRLETEMEKWLENEVLVPRTID